MMAICWQAKFTFPFIAALVWSSSQAPSNFHESKATYLDKRSKLLASEAGRVVGSSLVLNDKEKRVNDILLAAKQKEIQKGFKETFPPTVNFLSGKPLVEQSAVFDIIRRLPKGGILHIHDIAIADIEWVIRNITYIPNLYFCVSDDYYSSLRFKFSETPPPVKLPECRTTWTLVADARARVGDRVFDRILFSNLTMVTPYPDEAYPNTTMSWLRFQQALYSLTDLYFTTLTFKAFIRQSLQQFLDDNVQYMEMRTILFPLLEANGTAHPPEYTLQQFIEVVEEFKAEHPLDFVGAKLIATSIRVPPNRTLIHEQLKQAIELHRKYPLHMAGYDLVAQEDTGGPLIYYIDDLLYPSQQGFELPFFFHAGETNWEGTSVDDNLIDAILLNTTRIGHGYAVTKHPDVLAAVKSKGIAIELNPISNQVLHLVHDLRNHIGATLIADDYPVIISSDDPAVWLALPLSHDYYMAFMAMSDKDTGLTLLKQLALNTIKYSAMNADEKAEANDLWNAKWNHFLDEVLAKYSAMNADEKAEANDLWNAKWNHFLDEVLAKYGFL